jgi:hypothetical protein
MCPGAVCPLENSWLLYRTLNKEDISVKKITKVKVPWPYRSAVMKFTKTELLKFFLKYLSFRIDACALKIHILVCDIFKVAVSKVIKI